MRVILRQLLRGRRSLSALKDRRTTGAEQEDYKNKFIRDANDEREKDVAL